MTILAHWVAAREISTEVPSEQKPYLSGGDTVMRATSIGMFPLRNKSGISLRKIGI